MSAARWLGGGLALAAAIGLALQLAMFVGLDGLGRGAWQWLGFFTVWTNLLAVAVGLSTYARAGPLGGPRARLVLVSALAAIWLGYAQLLRGAGDEVGMQRIAGFILHDVTPPLAAALWIAAEHGRLGWRDLIAVVAWPAAFLLVATVRGAAEGWYPYGYLDPAAGMLPLAATSILLLIGALGAGLILLDRRLAG